MGGLELMEMIDFQLKRFPPNKACPDPSGGGLRGCKISEYRMSIFLSMSIPSEIIIRYSAFCDHLTSNLPKNILYLRKEALLPRLGAFRVKMFPIA